MVANGWGLCDNGGGIVSNGETVRPARARRVLDTDDAALLDRLLETAPRGLVSAYDHSHVTFAQTLRGVAGPDGPRVVPEGSSLRYAAIAALGVDRLDLDRQRDLLAGRTAGDLVDALVTDAMAEADPGAVALAAWAAAEVDRRCAERLFARLSRWLRSGEPLATVDVAWMATAATAADSYGPTDGVAKLAVDRLLEGQGPEGIFPHRLPASAQPRWRAHVGCFADQVYPVQALSRRYAATGDGILLETAERTAARICSLQGSDGQWWWHYDARTGEVVEGYPVYSVHQHAMAPMALLDLAEAGGGDHRAELAKGLRWLDSHPEVVEELVSERLGVVWRKVGRREPPKAARGIAAVTSWVAPGRRPVPGLDRAFPPCRVDYECRPYELGWLLYAWLDPQRPATAEAS